MYEVHPDDKGQWVLYDAADGDFLVVAWFTMKEDADFACDVFNAMRLWKCETKPEAAG